MPEESGDTREGRSNVLQGLLKYAGVFVVVGFLVGYGIWVGTIQNRLDSVESDISDVEKSISSIQKEHSRLRDLDSDRLVQNLRAFRKKFEQVDKDISDARVIITSVQTEMRVRFGSSTIFPVPGTPLNKRREALKELDTRVEQAERRIRSRSRSNDPLDGLSF